MSHLEKGTADWEILEYHIIFLQDQFIVISGPRTRVLDDWFTLVKPASLPYPFETIQ